MVDSGKGIEPEERSPLCVCSSSGRGGCSRIPMDQRRRREFQNACVHHNGTQHTMSLKMFHRSVVLFWTRSGIMQ